MFTYGLVLYVTAAPEAPAVPPQRLSVGVGK